MIDLHSHILPAIDDGARDMAMALEMARVAVDDGVEVMACTPHCLPGVYDPAASDILAGVDRLNERLDAEGINLVVVAGCEAHIRPDMITRLEKGDILPLHRSRHVLCEAPPEVLPPHMDGLFNTMISAGYTPILAHVERYRWVDRGLPMLQRMRASGVLMQVNAVSFFGDHGRLAKEWSMRLLLDDLVDLVASDTHDPKRRPPGLSRARQLVESELGAARARAMFEELPERILVGETVRRHQEAAAS